jgi:hypothetical protein
MYQVLQLTKATASGPSLPRHFPSVSMARLHLHFPLIQPPSIHLRRLLLSRGVSQCMLSANSFYPFIVLTCPCSAPLPPAQHKDGAHTTTKINVLASSTPPSENHSSVPVSVTFPRRRLPELPRKKIKLRGSYLAWFHIGSPHSVYPRPDITPRPKVRV